MKKVCNSNIFMRILIITIFSLIGGSLSSQNTKALTYSSDTNIGFTFNPTIGVSLSSDLHIDDLAPGSVSDSNIITVSVVTNTAYGYTLNATVGQATDYETRNLVLDGNNGYNFTSINYGSSMASLTTDNTWGYAYLPSTSGASWTTYSGLPLYSDTTNVATLISTDEAADNDSVQFKIAAKASNAQASGEYKNVINFVAVANPEPQLEPVACEAGKICYNVNSLDPTEGTMGKQSAGDNAEVMLLASNFSREGYGFAGWNTFYDYTGTNYGPQETITTPADTSTNGLSLYAIWVPSAGSLQGFTCPNNTAMPIGTVTALTDLRDNDTYAVAKLADGNCWMIENLRLENTNSDNATGALAQGYNASFAGLADPEDPSLFNNVTTANTLYSTDGSTEKTISGSNQGYRFPRYNNVNTPTTASDRPQNPTTNSATNSTSNASMYSYGNYYTWPAAIADTTAYNTNNQSVENTSICPSGWRLPKGGNKSNEANNEFWALVVTGINGGTNPANYDSSTQPNYTGSPEGVDASNTLRAYPNNFVYSGSVGSGSVSTRGSSGYYWSSTAYSSGYAYNLYFNSSIVSPGTSSIIKYYGRTIRCVASSV